MAADGHKLVVVGHDVTAKCNVANAILKQKDAFKQFSACRKLSVKSLIDKTLVGEKVRLVMTPNLNTPSWVDARESMISNRVDLYQKRIFIYIKDISSFEIDDKQSVTNIQNFFGRGSDIIIVIYHDMIDDKKAKETCQELVDMFPKYVICLKSSSELQKTDAANKILNMASNIVTGRVKQSQTTQQKFAGNEYVDSRTAKSPSTQTSKADKELDSELEQVDAQIVNTVIVEAVDRAKTPEHAIVKLDEAHFQLYHKALEWGMAYSYHTRVNVVGHQGAGKTTLVRRLQVIDIPATDKEPPTEGLTIDRTITRAIEIDGKRQWETKQYGFDKDLNYQRMAQAMKEVSKTLKEEAEGANVRPSSSIYVRDTSVNMGSDEVKDKENGSDEDNSEHITDWKGFEASSSKKEYLERVVKKMEYSPGERMYLAYWDFAGQATYYTTHQAFMSPSAVYLLVVDLSKPLHAKEKDSLQFRTHNVEEISVLESIRFWTGSITAYTANEKEAVAPVIVVGTHKDKVEHKEIEKIFTEVRNAMQIPEVPCIAIDNTLHIGDDSDLKELRDKIVDGGIGIIETRIPAKWIELEYSLIKLKNEGRIFIRLDELKNLDLETDAPISNPSLLTDFLEHEHCRGFLMYFPHGDLKDLIILDPTILVKFINTIMREKPKHISTMRDRIGQLGWCSDGIFDQTFLDNVIKSLDEINETKPDLELLVKLCIHLKIVYPKTTVSLERNASSFCQYFMPCLLENKPKDVADYSNTTAEKTPTIKISFEKKTIPPAFFHTLVSSLLSEWPPQKVDKGVTIYNHYVCFCIGRETFVLELYWEKSDIYLCFINFSSRRSLKTMQCDKHIQTVEEHIEEILALYRHINIVVTVSVRCPSHTNSFVSLTNLIQSEDRDAMCYPPSDEGKHHSVVAEAVLGSWFPDECIQYQENATNEQVQLLKTELDKVPDDKRLGRLARLLNFEEANGLATKLDMNDPGLVASRAIAECPHSKDLAHFNILKRWRDTNADSASTGRLLDLVTKKQLYRRLGLESELFKVVKTHRYEHEPHEELEIPPTDKQCGVMSRFIDNQYVLFFLELGLSSIVIEQEREQHGIALDRVIINLLIRWKERYIEKASIRACLDVAHMFQFNVAGITKSLWQKASVD